MTAEQRKVLLFFWTSIKHLPVEGFGGLASRLFIYKTPESCERLPSSHTCFFRLCFPPYPSLSDMRNRFSIITQEHVGCSFGTWWQLEILQSRRVSTAHRTDICSQLVHSICRQCNPPWKCMFFPFPRQILSKSFCFQCSYWWYRMMWW